MFDLVSFVGGALAGSYLIVALTSDTEPYTNDAGEEEYTLRAYLILGSAYVIKGVLKKALNLIGFSPKTKKLPNNVVPFPTRRFEEEKEDDDNELVV